MVKYNPLVSVITPVYNGEKYLSECIESVIGQNYKNFEYIILNNCSNDSTLDIAEKYSKLDVRIKINNNNNSFVGVVENHNIAFKLISKESKYCKVVSADDWIYPECITRMVEVAEANNSVGIVGSYQLLGGGDKWEVIWDGLPYSSSVISGRDICRSTLLGGRRVFGSPTSLLYRSDLVREAESFYPNITLQADLSAFYKYLRNTDFGFVHQVLSFERVHNESVSSESIKDGTHEKAFIRDFVEYGPIYLTEIEFKNRFDEILSKYYKFLAEGIFKFNGNEFFSYNKKMLDELGYNFICSKMAKYISLELVDHLFNPKKTISKIMKYLNCER